jgi:hypothetical protein
VQGNVPLEAKFLYGITRGQAQSELKSTTGLLRM